MIHRIASSHRAFRTLRFKPGLNILLAEKTDDASDRQSRNSTGKTSLVELIHFLLGANAGPGSIFRSGALRTSTFEVELDLGDATVTVRRSGNNHKTVELSGDLSGLPLEDTATLFADHRVLANEQWKALLATTLFGLPAGTTPDPFQPRVRSLLAYFARRQQDAGFHRTSWHSSNQQPWDQQVSLSFLLGLDWTVAAKFQKLREKKKLSDALRRADRSGALRDEVESSTELRTKLAISQSRVQRLRQRVDAFNVVPEYVGLEHEANSLTTGINSLSAKNLVDHALVKELRTALQEEPTPGQADIEGLYREASIVLPTLARRRLQDVKRFHEKVVQNRRDHLGSEIDSARRRVEKRNQKMARMDSRRAQIMAILESGGALDQYTSLREELGRSTEDSESLRLRLEQAEKHETRRVELKAERVELTRDLRSCVREQEKVVNDAILLFEGLSASLYESAGSLTIGPSENGPQFGVQIAGQRSKGITNMQTFCFDLMLMELQNRREQSPGFLIHDSHLFDGVDERQVAGALSTGAARAKSKEFQYIVTMNSDKVPGEGYPEGFKVSDYFMNTTLTDDTDTGGLFGIRF